jgi:hypothetical protein
MKVHDIKLSKSICDNLLKLIKTDSTIETRVREPGSRKGFITTEKEYTILEKYKQHKESGYINYTSKKIENIIPDYIFEYFNLEKLKCKIEIKEFLPGKLHIPHKDYYANYSHGLTNESVYNFNENTEIQINNYFIRIWISLTEPKFGHVLIIENKALYWLDQGTIVTWDKNELHSAANLGYENRYIMTITGEKICH